jgi:hypothetical protein
MGWRLVPGDGVFAQAMKMAGALAEAGVHEAVLKRDGMEERLVARGTDLPGVLAVAPPGTELVIGSHSIGIRVVKTGLEWKADDARMASQISAALGRP